MLARLAHVALLATAGRGGFTRAKTREKQGCARGGRETREVHDVGRTDLGRQAAVDECRSVKARARGAG